MSFISELRPTYGSLIALGFLLVLLVVIYMTNVRFSYRVRLFVSIVYTTGALILLEIINVATEGLAGDLNYTLFHSSMSMLLIITPIAAGLFGSYVDYLVFQDRNRLKKYLYYMHPLILTMILVLVNFVYPFVYTYPKETYLYARGPMYNVIVGSVMLMEVVILILSFKRQKFTHKKVFAGSAFYLMFPVAAAILQLYFFPTLLILYPATAIAVIFAYLTFESSNGSKDHLTKLLTRERMTLHLEDKIASNQEFTVIMIDIDNFKAINDTYGHAAGDEALIKFANTLKLLKGHKQITARWGGDEFLLIIDSIIRLHVREIRNNLIEHLHSKKIDLYDPITFSLGCFIREADDPKDVNEILKYSDQAMYADKEKSRELKRRKEDIF